MSKDTAMTMQDQLRAMSRGDGWIDRTVISRAADHIDQLEADKAELVDALEGRADECETQIVVIGHDGRRSNCGCGVCKSDRTLIAKHKAKHKAKP